MGAFRDVDEREAASGRCVIRSADHVPVPESGKLDLNSGADRPARALV